MSNKTRREFISSVPSSCLFVLALAVVLPGSLEGQRQFEFAGKRHLPGISTRTLGAAAADLDGDGDLDLVTGDVGVSNHIYINDGSGKFTLPAKWQIYSKDDTRGFALADFTGNGEIEIYVANFGRDQIYVRNKARGFWQNSNFRFDDIATESVVAADIDGDGDKDLILGVAGAANRIFINNGVSNFRNWFTDETQTRLPAQAREISKAVLAIDVDGDKDLDLVFANWLGQHRLYLNDGKGVFKEVTATHFPKSGEPTLDAAAADVDGDGDLDLIFSQLTTTAVKQTPALRLFLNNGKGMFTEARKGSLPVIEGDVSSVDFGDLDQDGDEDLVLGMGTSSITPVPQRQNLILLNDGKGRFTLSSPSNLSRANNFTRTVIVADFDGNKTPDIFFGNDLHYYGQRDQLHFNDGKGMFINGAENAVPATGFVIQAGDLDGDGSPDLIYQPADFGSALFGGFPYELLLNDGNGRFSRVARSAAPFDSAAYAGFRFFDVDGDKDRDLMVFRSEKLSLFLNKGDGTFTDATNQVPSFTVQYPFGANFLLIDLEGDGDMDVLMLGVSTRSQVLVNDGKGRFKFDFSGRVPRAVGAIATDLDKDGDSDLVLTVKRLQFYMNDGKGLFTLQKGAFPADAIAFPLFAIDVDGDSDLDVLAGGSLFLNNGKNVFTDRTFGRLPKNMGGATFVGDVDLDGDIDAVANGKLFLNDGKGIFFDVSARRLPDGASVKVVTGVDVDRDGDIDLFGRTGFGPILLSNLHRQSRSPLLLWLGREHRLENFSRPGYASKHQFVLPFLALGAARLFVPPFGTFGLDLKTTVVGPVLRTNPGTGSAVLKLPIPMLQSLIGIDIASQALILDDVILAMRLTNTVVDRIRY